MADPLLTTLCPICNISKPKYKCPRCSIRTCSLPCIKKHKAWAECSGERNATAYLPRTQLRTPAGVDHDYNLLYGLERKLERYEKEIVEERRLVQEEELRPATVQQVKWKIDRNGRRRKVLVTRALREAKGTVSERNLANKLKQLNVRVICAPQGMQRQIENQTTLNRRTGRINWQVEWLAIGAGTAEKPAQDAKKPSADRLLSKAMDDVPLYTAYHTALEARSRVLDRERGAISKGRRIGSQNTFDSTWFTQMEVLQEPCTAIWISNDAADMSGSWPSEREAEMRAQFDFFLSKPRQLSHLPTAVTKLDPDDCLRDILRGTTVREFPTIYVLRGGETLPPGFVLEPKDIMLRPEQQAQKRKKGRGQGNSNFVKRRKPGGTNGDRDLEEGELGSDYEDQNDNEDDDAPAEVSGGLEAGEVLDEQSLGEEDDDSDDDSPTSSSGSDID